MDTSLQSDGFEAKDLVIYKDETEVGVVKRIGIGKLDVWYNKSKKNYTLSTSDCKAKYKLCDLTTKIKVSETIGQFLVEKMLFYYFFFLHTTKISENISMLSL